jgi:hypothetical protein
LIRDKFGNRAVELGLIFEPADAPPPRPQKR